MSAAIARRARHGVTPRGAAAALALLAIALLPAPARAISPSRGERAAMVSLSAAYVGSALFGAHLAIRDTLHEAPFGMTSTRSVRREFWIGTGTALSPSMPALAAQSAVTVLVSGSPSQARAASRVLMIGGIVYAVGQLSEPLALRILRHPGRADRARLAVVVGNIVLPTALAIVAAQVDM